jgi:hypothetical protein
MKYTHVIWIVLILALFGIQQSCNQRKLRKEADKTLALKIQNQSYDSILNEKNQKILEQEVVIAQTEKSLKDYTDSIFNLKKENERKIKNVIAYYKNNLQVRVDSIKILYIDTVPIPIYVDSAFIADSMITVPRKFKIDSTNYSISGTVYKKYVEIDNFSLTDTIYGRFITEKGGLFKPDIIKYQVTNTNPHVNISGIQSSVYKPPKKTFLKKVADKAILVGVGVVVGVILVK